MQFENCFYSVDINYDSGIYELDAKETVLRLIKQFLSAVYDLWQISCEKALYQCIFHDIEIIVTDFNSGSYINLIDGILDLETFTLHNHSPDYYYTSILPFRFNASKECPRFHKYLSEITCGNLELQLVIQEMVGYCLSNSTKAEKAFFLIGNGSNGKSVLAHIIQELVGSDNCSSTTLTELSKSFGLAQMLGSSVNIASENSSANFSSDILKSIISGDSVEVNRKNKDALTVKLHTKLVMLFNELPHSKDLTYGFFRKILIIPFNKCFRGAEIDVNLFEKLKEEISGIFHWALEGLRRLQENKYVFSSCKLCEQAMLDYKNELNPVQQFFTDCFILDESEQIKKSSIYHIYSEYCKENSVKQIERLCVVNRCDPF